MRIGIISDTHLSSLTGGFIALAKDRFAECDMVVHAGDFTSSEVYFYLRELTSDNVIAVRGNMDPPEMRKLLPEKVMFEQQGIKYSSLSMGAGEQRLMRLLEEIYGAPRYGLILIDEIENGLDFNRLKYIINYFKDYSDDSQIIIASHSPLVCDFVHPKNWRVVKRKGYEVSFLSPQLQEDLDAQLDIFKHNHWDFYTKHISNSEKYNI